MVEVMKMRRLMMGLGPAMALVVFAWAQQAAPQDGNHTSKGISNYEEPEAYKIYSALSAGDAPEDGGSKTLTIQMETEPRKMCFEPDEKSEKIVSSAIGDYKKQNEKKWRLQRQFDLSQPYELISSDELNTLFNVPGGGGWIKFYERHPGSSRLIVFSAVGFNADKTVAILAVGESCGSLCAGGGFEILRKSKGKWMPLKVTFKSTCAWSA
jgi:hypothetical protein